MKAKTVKEVLDLYPDKGRDALIPILQNVQGLNGFLSKEDIVTIGEYLNLPTSKIYGVATFYNQFRFKAQGKYNIQVCRGTACHVKGSAVILNALEHELDITAGNTTRDGLFSIEVVACIGACGLAPVISVNGEFHANVDPNKIGDIINIYREKEKYCEVVQ